MKKIFAYSFLCICLHLAIPLFAKIILPKNNLVYKINMPEKIDKQTKVIVLLHGYGANEEDLFNLSNIFPKNYVLVCPRAPISLGNDGYKWMSTASEQNNINEIEVQSEKSMQQILALLQTIKTTYKLNDLPLIIGGFSQGAMMSNYIFAHSPTSINGVISLSGKLLPSLTTRALNSTHKLIPYFLVHGKNDAVIPFAEGEKVNAWLAKYKIKPTFFTPVMGHEITDAVILKLQEWLQKLP